MVGPTPAREEDAARITGARGDFVSGLGRRVEALRVSLRGIEQSPNDSALRHALLRRVHALSSASRVLGFASVAEALTEVEQRLRRSEFSEVARSLDLLPSLILGTPAGLRPSIDPGGERASGPWPLSVLIFGAQSLADAIQAIPGTHVECERTEDLTRAREQARIFGPDLAIIDADRSGAYELVEAFAKDPSIDRVPVIVIGDFGDPQAASAFVTLGAARLLSKPISAEALQRTVVELRARATEPGVVREPLGDLSVEALTERIAAEVRRGLLEAVEPSARGTSVGFGEGADVMAAVWGAVARVRELVTLRSSGSVRFEASGPEGAVPIAVWSNEERRAGERGVGKPRESDDVTLRGRRIVVADDDPAVVWFMTGLLKALGVEVLEAHDGARALALTYETWPDLVVSDVLMPKLDGFSLCHEIKRDVAVRDVPVILLSWKEDLLQRVRELGGDADGYLRKEAAASTVAERLREVLRPRARVERRINAGSDARGRLDGLTPRLILELASSGERNVRVGIRDAAYLYEVQIRRGRMCSATRSSSDGSFERGEFVLAALLGVSAGRFVVESDSSPCRADFDGFPAQILKSPIERARKSLNAISAGALVGVTSVEIAARMIEGYLACTPEPARGLLQRIMAGESPRELITSGSVAPRLLETVLSDVARRGGITAVERIDSEEVTTVARAPSVVPPSVPRIIEAALVAAHTVDDARGAVQSDSLQSGGHFSLQLESAHPSAVAPIDEAPVSEVPLTVPRTIPSDTAPTSTENFKPFSSEVTPSVDRLWNTLTEGVFNDGTLQGVGASLPRVSITAGAVVTGESASAPATAVTPEPPRSTTPVRAEELDALASALTRDSPSPPAALVATQEPTDLAEPAEISGELMRPSASSEIALPIPDARPMASAAEPGSVHALEAPSFNQARPAPKGSSQAGWIVRALLAFIVSYLIVSYLRTSDQRPVEPARRPLPASSR